MIFIDKVKWLQEMEAKAMPDWKTANVILGEMPKIALYRDLSQEIAFFRRENEDDAKFAEGLRNAAPRLLAVAGKFQPGDSELLEKAMACDESLSAHDYVAFLRRMAEAASIMEAEG